MMSRLVRSLIELNLFESGSIEIERIRRERWSTRIYLVLFAMILSSLAIYTAIDDRLVSMTITNPSYQTFVSLQNQYPTTFKCPCSKIAMKYQTFMQLKPSYHQICSSSFVSESWIADSYRANSSVRLSIDIRNVISSYSQFLRSFCRLSELALSTIIIDSLGSSLVSPQALSSNLLELKVNDQLNVIRSTGPWFLTASLVSVRLSLNGNEQMSGLETNAFVSMSSNGKLEIHSNEFVTSSNSICRCSSSNSCRMNGGIYLNSTDRILIKGMQIACSPLEGLVSSTLECFYNSSCFQMLISSERKDLYKPLNSSLPSRFRRDETIENLLSELLVEQWLFSFSAEEYLNECSPLFCEYSYRTRNTFLTIFTTLISVVAGLNSVLRFVIPFIIQYFLKMKRFLFVRSTVTTTTWVQPVISIDIERQENQSKLSWLLTKLRRLNLFNSDSNDDLIVRRELEITRIYLFVLTLICLIVLVVTTLTKQTNVYTINKPNEILYKNLFVKYGDTIECPCTNVTIAYKEFVRLSPRFHDICSSEWISSDFVRELEMLNVSNVARYDFVLMSANYFQWLSSFCLLSRVVILNLYASFQTELFVNEKLLSESLFDKQTNDIIQSFLNTIPSVFLRAFTEIVELTLSGQILSSNSMSFDLTRTSNGTIRIDPSGFANCSCLVQPQSCSTPAGFYSYNESNERFERVSIVRGIHIGCIPISSFTQSSLECWYTNDCYEQVKARSTSVRQFPRLLNESAVSRYNSSSSMLDLIENVLIEDWSREVSYDSYFDECEPQVCTYSVNERSSLILILTTLIGVFGGLNIILKLLIPLSVRSFYWLKEYVQSRNRRLLDYFGEIRMKIRVLNLFLNSHKSSELTLGKEIVTTRLYLCLFVIIFVVLVCDNLLDKQFRKETIKSPNETTYEELFDSLKLSSTSLECPCSRISIWYRSFVEMNARLHQVCSSKFVSNEWIESLYDANEWSNSVLSNDFRVYGISYFQHIQSLCRIAKGKIDTAEPYLFDRQLISDRVIPENELRSQIDSEIDQVRRSYSSTYLSLIQFARDTTQGNQLMSLYSSNWIYSSSISSHRISTVEVDHGENCSCAISSSCVQSISLDGNLLPGFVVGCLPLESIVRSTLICLYNQTCVDLINLKHLPSIFALNSSESSRFLSNETIEQMIPRMLIEDWSSTFSYSSFYNQCQPLSCSYSILQRKSLFQIVTILLGVYGSLTTILHFLSPILLDLFQILFNKCIAHSGAITLIGHYWPGAYLDIFKERLRRVGYVALSTLTSDPTGQCSFVTQNYNYKSMLKLAQLVY